MWGMTDLAHLPPLTEEALAKIRGIARKVAVIEEAKARWWDGHFPGQDRPSTMMPLSPPEGGGNA